MCKVYSKILPILLQMKHLFCKTLVKWDFAWAREIINDFKLDSGKVVDFIQKFL